MTQLDCDRIIYIYIYIRIGTPFCSPRAIINIIIVYVCARAYLAKPKFIGISRVCLRLVRTRRRFEVIRF